MAELAARPNFTAIRLAPHTPFVRIPVSLPLELKRHPVDVLHVQYIPPPFGRTPVVNMVHDLAVLHLPHLFPRREGWRQRLLPPRALRRAAQGPTGAEDCKEDILPTVTGPPAPGVGAPGGGGR